MNFGLIISYVIAGFLMIMIFTINYNVGFSNQEVTTTLIKKTHSQSVQDMIIHDIPKIGYEQYDKVGTIISDHGSVFVKADKHEISYYSDLSNDGTYEMVTWKYDPDKTPDHAQNPHVNTLYRTVGSDVTEITIGITNFEIRYYDEYGNVDTTSTAPMSTPITGSALDDIVQIEIEFEMQNDYTLNYRASDPERYVTTTWEKRFSPVNLRQD
ncbi:hypothetical protein ACKGJO_05725 [Gracilimonas sp. Q87]|uniref:hypothetical protein n=1 Tax=Gracilimonas sp. Q87 TaxID=3384766 RepID=UPI003984145A